MDSKKNDKGFAITTMLYGLLIIAALVTFMMLSLVTFNKKSNDTFVRNVERDMYRFGDSVLRRGDSC